MARIHRRIIQNGLNDPNYHSGAATHLEPDILQYEGTWASGSIIMNKASGGDGIPAELFKILKDDAVKVLHSICQQIWKTQQRPQDWKRSAFIPNPKKSKNIPTTIELCSFHMLERLCSKSFKLGFSSMWTENFLILNLGLEKAEEPKIKLPTFVGSWRKRGSSGKISACASLTTLKPITSWQIEREKWKQWQTLFSWAPKITVDGDCSHEIKRCLLLGRKAMTNLDSILISRDTSLLIKVHIIKAMFFPVIMYGCESEP